MKELVRRLDAEYNFKLTEEEIELIARQAEEADRLFQRLYQADLADVAPIMRLDKRKGKK
jgi:Asp-tRNA(Asn)/Glu-tRNA(Gln) amidotransferase C subunit